MRKTIATLACGLMLFGAMPAAFAQEGTRTQTVERSGADFDAAKQRALDAIERRLETLDRLTGEVRANEHVTDDHASALVADFERTSAGLTSLAGEIRAAATWEELRALTPKIAEDFRVYLVIVPKTLEVVASDTLVAGSDRVLNAAAGVQEAIDRAAEAGFDVSRAQELLDASVTSARSAAAGAGPVAGSVIDLGAGDWPDPAESLLKAGRSSLGEARSDLRLSVDQLRESISALRDAVSGS
jgi:hypothetical protein